MEVRVFCPTHCSGLKLLPRREHDTSENPTRRKRTLENGNQGTDSKPYALILQFSRDRIFWNIIRPWMDAKDSKFLMIAVSLLMKQFHQFLFLVSRKDLNNFEKILKNESLTTDDDSVGKDEQVEFNDLWYGIRILNKLSISFTSNSDSLQHRFVSTKKRRMIKKKFNIFLIPAYPSPSSHSTLYTEQLFARSLVKLENMRIRLQSLNAYVATLGGGYFLCRYLTTAISLAKYQRKLALALGDCSLAMKCTVNEAYNYIHAGLIAQANALIKKTRIQAAERKDDLVLSMCRSAKWFSDRVAEAKLYALENDMGGSVESIYSTTVDDYQRIRVVKDRNTFKKNLINL